jgi:hypothetical protein
LYSCYSVKGQKENNLVKYDSLTQQKVYTFVEKMPNYKGGDDAFMADFGKYFQYDFSKHNKEPVQTKLQVQFVIDTEGRLTGARIYNKTAIGELTAFENAGLKALNLMQNWQSGKHNGKSVNVLMTRIIHIDLNYLIPNGHHNKQENNGTIINIYDSGGKKAAAYYISKTTKNIDPREQSSEFVNNLKMQLVHIIAVILNIHL